MKLNRINLKWRSSTIYEESGLLPWRSLVFNADSCGLRWMGRFPMFLFGWKWDGLPTALLEIFVESYKKITQWMVDRNDKSNAWLIKTEVNPFAKPRATKIKS